MMQFRMVYDYTYVWLTKLITQNIYSTLKDSTGKENFLQNTKSNIRKYSSHFDIPHTVQDRKSENGAFS